MPARVDGPRNTRFDGDSPKDLHGLAKMDLHLCQCVDPKGYRRMVVVASTGKTLFTFPAEFWEAMGTMPQWLEDQVRPILFGKEAEPKKTSQKAVTQLTADRVDVM